MTNFLDELLNEEGELSPSESKEQVDTSSLDIDPNLDLGSQPEQGTEAPEVTAEDVVGGEEPSKPVQENQDFQLSDELVTKYLSEKLGKEITSFDDLVETKEVQVESEIEKDPYMKGLYDWKKKTGRPIEDYVKYQRDVNSLDDLSVAREYLKHEFPTLTEEEIELEIKSKFESSDEFLDEEEAKMRALTLKKYATKGREVLDSLRAELGEPLDKEGLLTEKQKEDLEFASKVREQRELLDQQSKDYNLNIKKSIDQLENLSIVLDGDKSIDFTMTPEIKQDVAARIDKMDHWKNPDGSWNHQEVVKDAIKSLYNDKMTSLAFKQGLSQGTENALKGINNTTLDSRGTSTEVREGDNVVIEGFDAYMQNATGIRKRRR